MKHFVINLRHRPFRLGFWLGYQFSKGLALEDVEVVDAIDKNDFSTRGELAQYAVNNGLDYWEPYTSSQKTTRTGYVALRITQDLLLQSIAQNVNEGELFSIWIDDFVLHGNLDEYVQYLEEVSKLGCNVVAMRKYPFWSTEEHKAIFDARDKYLHASGLVYTRCVGGGFNMVLVVTPKGASEVITFGQKDPTVSLLHLAYQHRDLTDNFIYTAVPSFIRPLKFFNSDIEDTKSKLDVTNRGENSA